MSVQIIKEKITQLFKTNPDIHMNVSLTKPRLELRNDAVKITGVYPNIFQIEEYSSGKPKKHILQYNDILTGHIEILEFEKIN